MLVDVTQGTQGEVESITFAQCGTPKCMHTQ